MAIGIKNIKSYVPQARESNILKKDFFGISRDFLREKIGIYYTSKAAKNENNMTMSLNAFYKLNINIKDIDLIIFVTQNPDFNGLPHNSSIIHYELGARKNCITFDIGLGCSGYVYSLSLAQSLMENLSLEKALIFTCDMYSRIIDNNDKDTSLIFGDAASVTLLENDNENNLYELSSFDFGTDGNGADALYNDNGVLKMNGRKVFNMAMKRVPKSIINVLEKEKTKLNDIDLYLLHQGSKYIVDNIGKKLKINKEKVPFMAKDYGNTVSSSIPLMLEDVFILDKLSKNIILSGFGVGFSWGSTLIKKLGD